MRADAEASDRSFEVRDAARGWRRAGVIDAATEAAIREAHPDDRVRVAPLFRTLLFVFTAVAIVCGYALLVFEVFSDRVAGPLALFTGLVSVVLTEIQTGRWKRAQGGTEAATSSLGVLFLLLGSVLLLEEHFQMYGSASRAFLPGLSTVLFALAAWRWGFPLYGALSAASLFSFVACYRGARLWWMILAAALFWPLTAASESPRFSPSLRRASGGALMVALIAFYVAVHVGSLDVRLLELWSSPLSPQGPETRWLFITGTALVPVVVFAFGIRTRRRLFLDLGLLMGVTSLVTLRFYVKVAPAWVVLIGAGTAAMAVVFSLRRFLETGPGGERGGFTASPLFESASRKSSFEIGAAVATLSPAAQTPRAEPFKGGGGEFGGGGASGGF